jgi:hypothetical protein
VHADVAAREVICGGTVEGNIVATEKVRVQGTGLVQGDIDSPSIVIEDGGGVEGFVQMAPPGGEPDEAEEPAPMPVAPPASGRLSRAPRSAEASAPAPPAASMASAGTGIASPGTGVASSSPPKLTREMLMGGQAPALAPSLASSGPPSAPAMPQGTGPSNIFDDADAPLAGAGTDAGPLGGNGDDVQGSGNGSDGPLMSGHEQGADASKRPLPDF